jgi:AhpD family alkylhydroperoxidase
MTTTTPPSPGPYTLANLLAEARRQVPPLLASLVTPLPPDAERLSGRLRLVVWLRLARTLGCPVCLGVFPSLARRRGITADQVDAALHGRLDALPADWAAGVTWADAIVAAGGERPAEVPDRAAALPEAVRDRLLTFVRMERLVHATGLMFLPHAWVLRAAGLTA